MPVNQKLMRVFLDLRDPKFGQFFRDNDFIIERVEFIPDLACIVVIYREPGEVMYDKEPSQDIYFEEVMVNSPEYNRSETLRDGMVMATRFFDEQLFDQQQKRFYQSVIVSTRVLTGYVTR